MSGHSHWKTVKYRKAITDSKRSKIFSKISRMLTVAARQGGDIEANPTLRLAVDKAKEENMSADTVEKAIKRGTGELEGVRLEEFLFEAYGPGKIAIMIEGITDNKNRTLADIKQILSQHRGKLADTGSVQWLFERKGAITISPKPEARSPKDKERLELLAIEAGAEDIYWHDDLLDVYVKPEGLEKVKNNLENQGVEAESVSLDWTAKETIELAGKDKEVCQSLFEALDDNEAVQEIYSNLRA